MILRHRLPARRRCETTDIEVDGQRLAACIGFYPDGRPAELFMSGPKDGSGLAAILADASVIISIALQHGVPAAALAKSVAREPETVEGPALRAASAIGVAVDQLRDARMTR